MSDPIDALILDLLEWIGPYSRPYVEVIDAWRTSCPRLTVWEDANERGFIERRTAASGEPMVGVSASGAEFLAENGRWSRLTMMTMQNDRVGQSRAHETRR